MKKIYLLVFFYLLKIDFCGMEDEFNNNQILNDLFLYSAKKIPNQIQKPKYDKEIGNLFKIEDFKVKEEEKEEEKFNIINEDDFNENEEEINNNEINIGNEWEEQHKEILQNIRNKEIIFEGEIADDNNEENNVGCCCFVSRKRFDKVQNAYKTYSEENKNLKSSGKDIIDLNKDYRNALDKEYKKLFKEGKKKEENIKQREVYEEKLKDKIKKGHEEYMRLLNHDKELENNFEAYNKDYSVIKDYYNEGKRLAGQSISEIEKLISSLKQKEKNIEELNANITKKEEENNREINAINEKKNNLEIEKRELQNKVDKLTSLLEEKENKIENLKVNITKKEEENNGNIKLIAEKTNIINKLDIEKKGIQNDKENLLKDLKEKNTNIENLNSQINELNLNIKDNESQKKLEEEKHNSKIEKINIEKKILENNFKEQIEKLNNTINELKTSNKLCEVEKENIEKEKNRLELDTKIKEKEIEKLQTANKQLQEKILESNTTYNKNIQEIKEKNNDIFQLYVKECTNNNDKHNELLQKITNLNLNWNNSFNTLNDDNKRNLENIINSNENFNKKKQEEFNTTINVFIEEQKKMIEDINKSNNEKLREIFNYYNTTVKDFMKKYDETLDKIGKQANNYEEAVKKLETNLSADSTKNSTAIIQSVFKLTSNINGNFKKTCEELNNQKKQFSDDVKKLENNINNVIKENINTINSNMNSLNDKTNKNVIDKIDDLNKNNMIELEKQANSFKQDLVKKNEEYINSNNNLNTSLSTLKENIGKWSQDKEELKKKIQELEAENKRLKEEKDNLNLVLNNKEKENSSLNNEKEKLNSSYEKLQEEIKEIGKELDVEEENKNEKGYTRFALQTLIIKNKIKALQEKNKNNEANYKNLKEKNKKLNDENDKLRKEKYDATTDKLEVNNEFLKQKIELLTMQSLDNNNNKQNVKNKEEINTKIEELKKDIDKKFKAAKQAVSDREKNEKLEKKVSEQEEQLKATALGFDLKEQQEFDNYANKMRQENIRKILNDATIGDTMKKNSDNKNENEILKEEYYLPFIFENYNINNKWICLKKCIVSLYEKKTQKIENEIALKDNEIVYDEKLIYKSFDDVFFENLEKSKEFSKIELKNIASKKIKKQSQNDKKDEKKKDEEKEKFEVKNVDKKKLESYGKYKIYIRRDENKILLGNQFCEAAVNILKNFPDAELYLLFIKTVDPKTGKCSSIYCYFYLKEIPLQKFMEYCAFVQGCSLAARIQTYGEYLSMYINDIVTGSAAIERNNFKYFTKEDLQSIFPSLFSNRWFKGQDISQPSQDGDLIPKEILSYPELLIKPLNKNEYTASKIIEKELQHPYIEKKIETKVREYDGKTVFWYKCDMQDPVTYLLSECIGLGNYGYIGRFYKRDGQGNYYPVALKLTLDSEPHEGGSHKAIMKEIKAGKAAAVMGCNRMIYSNKAGLIKLNNSNFIKDIAKEDFSNMFLDPSQFIEEEKKMKNNDEKYRKLLLAEQKYDNISDIYYRKDPKMNIEKLNNDTFKKVEDYKYRINFLEERFKNFYDSEKFKKFHNLMFNEDNKVQNTLLYVMEMDIIDEKDEDLYTETTTEKTKNNEEKEIKEEKIEQKNEINEENKEININDDIKNTINNIAEYLTAQNKCGVIHGDIKAKNMTKNKFLDFGSFDMVTNYGTNTNFSDVVGTPEYWDLVRIFNKQLELVAPYDALLKDYQLSDLYASIVALYYYMFKEYPAFATLIIIIKSILKHYINDVKNNNNYYNYEKKIEDFIDSFPIGKKLVECTKAFEKDKKLKKQINNGIKDNNGPKEEKEEEEEEGEEEEEKEDEEKEEKEEKENLNLNLNKFNKYLKDVEDKNYLINEVKQLRYCIYQIIQHSLLTVEDIKNEDKRVEEGDKNKLFFIMSKDKNFYFKGKDGWQEVNDFSEEVVKKLIEKYEDLRKKELENIEKLTGSEDKKKNMLGRIMYQILQQGTFANSEKYPAFKVYKNEHSYNNKTQGYENYRRENLDYRKTKSELINKIRNKVDKKNIDSFLKDNEAFWEDYKERLSLIEKSYLYTLEPLSIKSLITQQPYYNYNKSFIDTINEEKKGNEEKK